MNTIHRTVNVADWYTDTKIASILNHASAAQWARLLADIEAANDDYEEEEEGERWDGLG